METATETLHHENGRDFLTYISYLSDTGAGTVRLPDIQEQIAIWIDGKIVFEDNRDTPANTVSYSGDHFTDLDLKQALRSGKKVKEARFRIEKGENTWSFILRADHMDVTGLKLDMPQKNNDPDERFYGRVYSIEALNTIIDTLYTLFVNAVRSRSWKTTGYKKFQAWLARQ